MANVPITKQTLTHNNTGFNLTDATYTTVAELDTATFAWSANDMVVVKVPIGEIVAAAIELRDFPNITQYGGTVNDPFLTFDNGGSNDQFWLFRLPEVCAHTDGNVRLTVDGSGEFDFPLRLAVLTM